MTVLRRARPLLGTLVEIQVTDTGRAHDPAGAIQSAFAAIERVQAEMGYHDAASALSRLNRDAAQSVVTVGDELWQVLVAAQRLSELSDGIFDVSVARTLERAGFLPEAAGMQDAQLVGSWRDIELRAGRQVRFARPLRIDLGGIAKGYAVDRAIESLAEAGVAAAVVNAGGDLRAWGERPATLALRHPTQPTELVAVDWGLDAVATTAGYFMHRSVGGREVCPVVETASGRCCPAGRSVTVFAAECMTADALTKVLYVDPARAKPLLEAYQARAVVLALEDQAPEAAA